MLVPGVQVVNLPHSLDAHRINVTYPIQSRAKHPDTGVHPAISPQRSRARGNSHVFSSAHAVCVCRVVSTGAVGFLPMMRIRTKDITRAHTGADDRFHFVFISRWPPFLLSRPCCHLLVLTGCARCTFAIRSPSNALSVFVAAVYAVPVKGPRHHVHPSPCPTIRVRTTSSAKPTLQHGIICSQS